MDKIFWRERHAGFRLPANNIVRDSEGKSWLRVEYIPGVDGQRVLCQGNDRESIDSFLSSYTEVLDDIISHPSEPFPSDVALKQFRRSEDDTWYVVDLEPRVKYFDDENVWASANKRFLSAVYRVENECHRFRDCDKQLSQTEVSLRTVIEKTLCHKDLFEPHPKFIGLQRRW